MSTYAVYFAANKLMTEKSQNIFNLIVDVL